MTGKIKILNEKTDRYTIDDTYIGRGSILGNPFTHLPLGQTKAQVQVKTREDAILAYKNYAIEMIKTDKAFRGEMVTLLKKLLSGTDVNLVCYCKPLACHGDVIKEILENELKRIQG